MFRLKDVKIRRKLAITFFCIALVASFAGVIGLGMMMRIDKRYSNALENYGFVQGDIGGAMLMLAEERGIVRDLVGLEPGADTSSLKQELASVRTQYDSYISEMSDDLISAQEQELFDEIQREFSEFQSEGDSYIQRGYSATKTQKNELLSEMATDHDPLYNELLSDYQELMNIKVNDGDALSQQMSSQSSVMSITLIAIMIVIIVVALIYGNWLSREIAVPLEQCADRLQKLAQGDLNTPVPDIDAEDETGMIGKATAIVVSTTRSIISEVSWALEEIGNNNLTITSQHPETYVGDYQALKDSLQQIIRRLTDTILLIDESSDQVNSGADQVSDGAQSLSQGATEQAATVEELSSTLAETTRQIEQSAESAGEARTMVQKVGAELGDSNAKMNEMITAMDLIHAKSNEIGKIIKTIDDIAFQTNILALNAAVEAARAGSAGKGFAVVADEVRNLAGKSADAAKNTQTLIEETVSAVEKGVALAKTTEESMLTVVGGAQKVITIIDNISVAAQDQADSVRQFKSAVDQISSVTQTTAATAEESAAACEELSAQSEALKTLVRKFKLSR